MSTFRGIALTVAAAHLLGCGEDGGSDRLAPEPTVLATGMALGEIVSYGKVVSDGQHVYWSEGSGGGTIRRVAVTGGTPQILATGLSLPDGIDLDDTSVYWVDNCCESLHVRKVPKAGGTPVDLAAIPAEHIAHGLTVRAGWVYVAVTPFSVYLGGILRVATEGGPATWLIESATCTGVAVNDAAVYCSYSPSSATELPLAGGASTGWITASVLTLAAAGTTVYWTETDRLMTASSGSLDMATSLGPIAPNAFKMALGREHVFLTSYDRSGETTGSIVAFPLTGSGVPVTLADGLHPVALTADANSVFWVSDGTLTRLSY
jgi:hypothetical protein